MYAVSTHLEGDAKPGDPDGVAAVAHSETYLPNVSISISIDTCTHTSIHAYMHTDVWIYGYMHFTVLTHLEGDAEARNSDRVAAVAQCVPATRVKIQGGGRVSN